MINRLDKGEFEMNTTKDLLDRALKIRPAKQWCDRYSITEGYLSTTKKRGHLSPALAGNFAMDLGEDAKHWMIIAALETDRDNPINKRLRERLLGNRS